MKEICSKCNGKFIESSAQYYYRFQKDTYPICPICVRKDKVNKANKKLSKEKELTLSQQLKRLKRKYGILSVAYLMRKFKVTVPEAKRLMDL